jgi:Major tropism determinant N-terminal domain
MIFEYEDIRFTVRGGTASDLAAVNEVPLERELVFEIDTGRSKLGDGVTDYNSLPYTSGGAPIELRANTTHLQWRQTGAADWINLVLLDDLKGADGDDGRQIELRVTSTHFQTRYVGDETWTDQIALSSLKGDPGPPGPASSNFPTITFDGGLGDIRVGHMCQSYVPFGYDISRVTLLGNPAGTLQIDIRVTSFAAHPPGPTNTICAGSPPTLANAEKMQDSLLTGWSKTVPSGSTIRFVVTACNGVNIAQITLEGSRT